MLGDFTVIGRVTEVFEDRGATMVVVATSDRDSACLRFWGDKSTKYTQGIGNGDLILAKGSVGSRKYKDKYYTDLNANFARVMGGGANVASKKSDDDNSVPF